MSMKSLKAVSAMTPKSENENGQLLKKRPYFLTVIALVLLFAALLVDNLIVRLSTAVFGIIVLIVLILEIISFILVRRSLHAQPRTDTSPKTEGTSPAPEENDTK